MINVSMDILGDPAWISQSQFIPMNLFESKGGTAERKDVDYWQGGVNHVWNDKWKCYNFDVADPLIMLKFKMPTDANDKKIDFIVTDHHKQKELLPNAYACLLYTSDAADE